MSKDFKALFPIFPLILLILNNCSGQDIEAVIKFRDAASSVAEISGKFTSPRADKHLSILRDFGGFSGLADRISDVSLESSDGQTVAFKQFMPGEYVAEKEFTSWRYRVNLAPTKRSTASGHTSWVASETGLLFLRDLLPLLTKNSGGKITLELPNGWSSSQGAKTFTLADVDAATILIGRGFRTLTAKEGNVDIRVFAAGTWTAAVLVIHTVMITKCRRFLERPRLSARDRIQSNRRNKELAWDGRSPRAWLIFMAERSL